MDDNDAPRSRVPAGTFGDSTPPSSGEVADGSAPPDRKRFADTLVGEGALADASPEELEELSRKRHSRTLLGQPSPPPAPPNASGSVAPVLSPPKWRGAAAYLEGDREPQPHVSSIPTPPPLNVPDRSGADDATRSKVTTKVGLPTVAQPTSAAEPSRERDPEIDVEIQQMLDGQAAVPMQVEEPVDRSGLREAPFEELPIEEIEGEAAGNSAKAAAGAAESASSAPSPGASAEERIAEADAGAVAAATEKTMPQPGDEAPEPREVSAGTRRKRRAVASVTPAAIRSRAPRSDAQVGRGLLFLGLMLLVGGGGWLGTRGGYVRTPPPAPAAKPEPAQAAPENPSENKPAEADAPRGDEPSGEAPHGADEPARARSANQRASRRERASERPGRGTRDARRSPSDEAPVLTVRPRTDDGKPGVTAAGNLPETPSREAVIQALEALRPALSACVGDQHGVAQLDITVSGAGYVSHAVVGGDFAGSPEGSCIARATRAAKFAPFKKPRFRVIYPYSL